MNARGRILLRLARELREVIDFSVQDDDVQSLKCDVEELEEIGRWLSSVTPIDANRMIQVESPE